MAHSMDDLNSPKALVCHSERGGDIVWKVLLADGYLIDCGTGGLSERRANLLAEVINQAGPAQFGRQALAKYPKEQG